MRAYGEINEFEEEIAENGGIVTKFWLQISPEEQLRRFKEREKIKHKNFKITPEDWRNRDKWDAYQRDASDMIERTHTKHAPWVLVEANDKYFARIKIMKALVERLEAQLEGRGRGCEYSRVVQIQSKKGPIGPFFIAKFLHFLPRLVGIFRTQSGRKRTK